jgi:hypothetical protein
MREQGGEGQEMQDMRGVPVPEETSSANRRFLAGDGKEIGEPVRNPSSRQACHCFRLLHLNGVFGRLWSLRI